MHLTRAIPYIALTLFARKSSRKCHTVRTFGLTAVTGKRRRKKTTGTRRRIKKKKRKKRATEGEWVYGKKERDRKRAVREEFETLSTGAREREADGDGATGNRKRPGVQSKNPFSF